MLCHREACGIDPALKELTEGSTHCGLSFALPPHQFSLQNYEWHYNSYLICSRAFKPGWGAKRIQEGGCHLRSMCLPSLLPRNYPGTTNVIIIFYKKRPFYVSLLNATIAIVFWLPSQTFAFSKSHVQHSWGNFSVLLHWLWHSISYEAQILMYFPLSASGSQI